jgi:hypothetical protein
MIEKKSKKGQKRLKLREERTHLIAMVIKVKTLLLILLTIRLHPPRKHP